MALRHFNHDYGALYPGAPEFSPLNGLNIFLCIDTIFCVERQRVSPKLHTNYFTHTLDTCFSYMHGILRCIISQSMYAFLKCRPDV